MNLKKIFIWAAAALLILIFLLILIAACIYNASLPQQEGEIFTGGISEPVQISFDSLGIPQVWAVKESDALFAMGWLHASDRLFQMDLTRRMSAGTLSDFFSTLTVEVDRFQRRVGHTRQALKQIDRLSPRMRTVLNSYCTGINTCVENMEALPFEYYLLGKDFEPWTLKDCLTILSYQTWFSNALQNRDDLVNKITDIVGPERAESLFSGFPDWAPHAARPVPGSAFNGVPDWLAGFPVMREASNCWVVAPKLTRHGAAILASDPHLSLTMLPQFWYAAGIHIAEIGADAVGLTSPGLPYIAYGHNGTAAWAFTAGGIDVTDQYIEKINPKDRRQYLTPQGWQEFERIPEIIAVNGRPADTLTVLISRHGPVISHADSDSVAISLRWAGHDMSLAESAASVYDLMLVKDFASFRKKITGFAALDANWLYTDVEGNIGYQLGTPLPVRQVPYSNIRLPGWVDDYEWLGYEPLENTPHAFNPGRGWLASCNNKPGDPLSGKKLLGNFAADRILRLEKLLATSDILDAELMREMQLDFNADYLMRWKKILGDVLDAMGEQQLAARIREWDGAAGERSYETLLIDTWLAKVKEEIFTDELGESAALLQNRFLYRDHELESLFNDDENPWFDDISTPYEDETVLKISVRAMQRTLDVIGDSRLGDRQTLTMSHAMGDVPFIGWLLNLKRGPFPRGGSSGTLNATSSFHQPDGSFKVMGGPSMRLVIDFADLDAATIVLPAGQSGNPASPHFFDFFDRWNNGQTWKFPFSRRVVMRRAASILSLKPAK